MACRRAAPVSDDRPKWSGATRDETLVRLCNDGLSAKQIMPMFSEGPSRSAIIGRVSRLQKQGVKVRLEHGHGGGGRKRAGKPPAAPKPATRRVSTAIVTQPMRSPHNPHHSDFKGRAEQRANSPGLVPALIAGTALKPVETAYPVPTSLRVPLIALTDLTCRWPHGDAKDDDFHFCGHQTGGKPPWCGYHRRLAWAPARTPKEKPQHG